MQTAILAAMISADKTDFRQIHFRMSRSIRAGAGYSIAQQVKREAMTIESSDRINWIVSKYTPWKTLQELCDQAGNYRPTIRCTRAVNRTAKASTLRELLELANAYDAAQESRGDLRRAFRG